MTRTRTAASQREARKQKYADLDRLITEYAELMYPDDAERESLSDKAAEEREWAARSAAVRIADLVIQLPLLSEIKRRAGAVERYADEIMQMIDDDISEGVVPADVASFVDLHDHVDANEYTLCAGVPFDLMADDDDGMDLVYEVEAEVARRLAERAAYAATDDDREYVVIDGNVRYMVHGINSARVVAGVTGRIEPKE